MTQTSTASDVECPSAEDKIALEQLAALFGELLEVDAKTPGRAYAWLAGEAQDAYAEKAVMLGFAVQREQERLVITW